MAQFRPKLTLPIIESLFDNNKEFYSEKTKRLIIGRVKKIAAEYGVGITGETLYDVMLTNAPDMAKWFEGHPNREHEPPNSKRAYAHAMATVFRLFIREIEEGRIESNKFSTSVFQRGEVVWSLLAARYEADGKQETDEYKQQIDKLGYRLENFQAMLMMHVAKQGVVRWQDALVALHLSFPVRGELHDLHLHVIEHEVVPRTLGRQTLTTDKNLLIVSQDEDGRYARPLFMVLGNTKTRKGLEVMLHEYRLPKWAEPIVLRFIDERDVRIAENAKVFPSGMVSPTTYSTRLKEAIRSLLPEELENTPLWELKGGAANFLRRLHAKKMDDEDTFETTGKDMEKFQHTPKAHVSSYEVARRGSLLARRVVG